MPGGGLAEENKRSILRTYDKAVKLADRNRGDKGLKQL